MNITHYSERTAGAVPEWTLGDRMRRAMRHSGMSVEGMANALGSSPATLGRWLNDRGPVKRAALMAWASVTGVDLEWLETGQAPTSQSGPDEVLPRLDSNQQPSGYLSLLARASRSSFTRRRAVLASVQVSPVVDLDSWRDRRAS